MSRSRIDAYLDKDLFQVEGIGPAGANALHIQVSILIAKKSLVAAICACKEETHYLLQTSDAGISPGVPTLFPDFLDNSGNGYSQTDQYFVGQEQSTCHERIVGDGW